MCGLPVDVSGASEVDGGFEGDSLQAPGDEASLRFSARSLLCSSVHLKGSRWCLIYKPVKGGCTPFQVPISCVAYHRSGRAEHNFLCTV